MSSRSQKKCNDIFVVSFPFNTNAESHFSSVFSDTQTQQETNHSSVFVATEEGNFIQISRSRLTLEPHI